MTTFRVRSKNLLWKPVVRARRGEIEVNFWGTLPAKGRNTKTGTRSGYWFGQRPLFRPRALLIWLWFWSWRRLGTPKSSIEERDFLDLAPVDEGGQHEGPAGEVAGVDEVVVKQEGEGGQAGGLMVNISRANLRRDRTVERGGYPVTIFPSHLRQPARLACPRPSAKPALSRISCHQPPLRANPPKIPATPHGARECFHAETAPALWPQWSALRPVCVSTLSEPSGSGLTYRATATNHRLIKPPGR